jgi:hypothetical protein
VGTPGVRFGGLSVFDSGSTAGATGSLFWDSQNNNWVYQQVTGSTYTGGMLISGPRNTGGLGNEAGTTNNAVMKGMGGDHITSSAIFEVSGSVGIGTSAPFSTLTIIGQTSNMLGSNTGSALVLGQGGSTGNYSQIGFTQAITSVYSPVAIGYVETVSSGYTYGDFVIGTRNVNTDTAPTERMRITNAGSVGIGTTAPSTTLDVSGSGRFTGTLNIGNDVTNSSLVFKTGGSTSYSATISTNSNVDQFNILGGSTAGYDNGSSIGLVGADRYGTKTAGMLTLSAGNAVNNTTYGYISMNTGNTERIRISYAGNTGIGTSSPSYLLDLSRGGNNRMINITGGGTGYQYLNWENTGASLLIGIDNSTGGGLTTGAAAYSSAITTQNATNLSLGTNNAERMRITSTGYVGIGTTSPTNTLQVNGNIRYGSVGLIRNTQVTLTGTSATGDVFRFLDSNGSLMGQGAIAGTLHVVAYDLATGGNQTQYEIRILSGGNGTGNASLTVVSNLTRGTAPMANLTLVNDGGGGGVKIQGTTAASGVTGAILWFNFVGTIV